MNRSLRRHHDKVAKVHRLNVILANHSPWWKCVRIHDGIIRPLWEGREIRIYRPVNKQIMLTPSSHHRERMHRPARIKANHFCHLVERGIDPDSIHWPDHKKPYVYYW
jgi:hypothetical protein